MPSPMCSIVVFAGETPFSLFLFYFLSLVLRPCFLPFAVVCLSFRPQYSSFMCFPSYAKDLFIFFFMLLSTDSPPPANNLLSVTCCHCSRAPRYPPSFSAFPLPTPYLLLFLCVRTWPPVCAWNSFLTWRHRCLALSYHSRVLLICLSHFIYGYPNLILIVAL